MNLRFCALQLQEYCTHHNTCNTWMVLTVQARSIFTIASIIGSILTWIVGSAAVMEELSSPSVGSPRRCRLNMGGDCGAGSPGGDVIEYPYVNTPKSTLLLVLNWYCSGTLLLVTTCQHSKVDSTSGTLVLRWYSTDTLLVLCF